MYKSVSFSLLVLVRGGSCLLSVPLSSSLLSVASNSPHFCSPFCFLTLNLFPAVASQTPPLVKAPIYHFKRTYLGVLLTLTSTSSALPPLPGLLLCRCYCYILLVFTPRFPPVLNFYLDSRWGLHADRLVVSKEQRCARSVPGLSLLQAADHALTSCHLTSDLLVGDVAITQGRHYWACSVEPGSYLVKARMMNVIHPVYKYYILCMWKYHCMYWLS